MPDPSGNGYNCKIGKLHAHFVNQKNLKVDSPLLTVFVQDTELMRLFTTRFYRFATDKHLLLHLCRCLEECIMDTRLTTLRTEFRS